MSGSVENNTTLNLIEGKVLSVPLIDNTLTKTGRSADAKAVGDQVARLDERIDNVDPHFAKNVQYDNASSGLSATNMQRAIEEIYNAFCKCDYYEDIVIKGTLYGKGYYLETHNMVIMHIPVATTSNMVTGEVFAELSKLSKNMQKIDNVGILDMDGNGYGFKFENKSIVTQSNIPQGARLLFDLCIKIS